MLVEPLKPERARHLIRKILENGSFSFSGHAERELKKDDLTTLDAVNVLRAGVVEPGEFEKGCWRYQVRTRQMTLVIAFRSESEIRVVTAWREKR